MSFSFSFIADDAKAAIAKLEEMVEQIPSDVAALVRGVLGNYRHTGKVSVTASGHLCNSDSSGEHSSMGLTIMPIVAAAEEPAPAPVIDTVAAVAGDVSVNETQATESQV